jgi:HAL2 family 3'(2'),5'-bisphosphate nucleotidase
MPHPYEHERRCAIAAVRAAARLCRSVRQHLDPGVLEKKDLSPVTVADYGSQALICHALAETCPDVPVIAEEDAADLRRPENAALLDRVLQEVRTLQPRADAETLCRWIDHGGASEYSEQFWTLDPIDGTKGFLRNEQYAIALALIVNGRIAVAAMACPNLPLQPAPEAPRGVVFAAVRGQGAEARPLDADGPGTRIHVSSPSDPSSARFCESVESAHSAHGDAARIAAILGITTAPIRLDSQGKYAVVARGEADIYLRLPTRADYREKIWDHASGVLIVAEAGGLVTDIAGRPLEFTHGRELTANRGVIVTNGHWHDRVLQAIAELGLS